MSPEDLDVLVFGSALEARQAQIDSALDGMVDVARRKLAAGYTPAHVAAGIEVSLTKGDCGDGQAAVGLAYAVVRLAQLPDLAARP